MSQAAARAEQVTGHPDGDFIVEGRYKQGEKEVIDCAGSQGEADALLGEYRMAYGRDWALWTRKRTVNDD